MSSTVPGPAGPAVPDHPAGYVLRKLPHVTLLFWILKIIAVTLGETAGDLFGITLQVGYVATALIFLVFFLVVLVAQVRAKRFHAPLFWAVVLGTSLVGTEISDLSNRGVGHGSAQNGIGYAWGAVILTGVLVIVFLVWWRTGQTYDVENIATRTGEILYWVAILVSNTLGTSSGDVLAHDTPLGFRGAFFVLAGVLLLLVAAHYLTAINGTVIFWVAFVLTRPLGAAGGDYLVKPTDEGGLGAGTMWGSLALLAVLTLLALFQAWRLASHPLEMLPAPANTRTGEPQEPNGRTVLAYGPRPEQIVHADAPGVRDHP